MPRLKLTNQMILRQTTSSKTNPTCGWFRSQWVAKKTAGRSPRIPGRNYDLNLLEEIVGSSKLKRRRCGGLCVRYYSLAIGLSIGPGIRFLDRRIRSIYPHLSPTRGRGQTRDLRELRQALRWCSPMAPIRQGPFPMPASPRPSCIDEKIETQPACSTVTAAPIETC